MQTRCGHLMLLLSLKKFIAHLGGHRSRHAAFEAGDIALFIAQFARAEQLCGECILVGIEGTKLLCVEIVGPSTFDLGNDFAPHQLLVIGSGRSLPTHKGILIKRGHK